MVKGPLTVTDMVCWHVGMGMGLYGVKPLRSASRTAQRIPRFFHRDDLNVPDVMQRVHWDPEFARTRRATRPPSTTAACARPGSSTSAPTGWATTPGSGSSTASSAGSTTSATRTGSRGTRHPQVPRRRRPARGRPRARGENQRGEVTTPGHATILLPSREHGPVRLPDPPGGATRPAGRARRASPTSSRADDRRRDDASVAGLDVALDGGVLRAHARPARQAQRDRRRDDATGSSTRVDAAGDRRARARDPARRRGRPLLRRRRHRRPQRATGGDRSRAPAASSAGCRRRRTG